MTFGAGKDRDGVVIMITLGTGIGSAVFLDGKLLPNTELGHLKMGKKDAEKHAAESVREAQGLSWKEWASRLDEYLLMVEALFSPDLFIVGGGISKKSDKFLSRLSITTEIVPAQLLNEAGIVGGALAHSLHAPVAHTD
jgi:polyphosphate glucokinase